ncbi:MAG TPA: 1-deoxy-D-xylulose-5-phosphate synthase [Candidatus Hydrogenedentes bacterium]|nr:1-deoxy-D-xylulose-5-phosphate synthase [Candidatus Hydrogenedentota bacterium]
MRDAFGQALLDLADAIPELVVLDADVASSTKTRLFWEAHPDRFLNVGVAEANMVDIAAGMATCGLRPVVSTFALFFALKCTDQIRNVVCYNTLPVVFAAGYAGLSDSYDGASHQSVADLAIVRAMPNMYVVVPADAVEAGQALEAALRRDGPTFIRLCRNPTPVLFANTEPLASGEPFAFGKARKLRDGIDLTIAVCGVPTAMALEAADQLAAMGVSVDLVEVATLKPLDVDALVASVAKTGKMLTVEEHTMHGGLYGAVAEALARHRPAPMDCVAIEDTFAESGPYDALMAKYGISVENITRKAAALAGRESVRPR